MAAYQRSLELHVTFHFDPSDRYPTFSIFKDWCVSAVFITCWRPQGLSHPRMLSLPAMPLFSTQLEVMPCTLARTTHNITSENVGTETVLFWRNSRHSGEGRRGGVGRRTEGGGRNSAICLFTLEKGQLPVNFDEMLSEVWSGHFPTPSQGCQPTF